VQANENSNLADSVSDNLVSPKKPAMGEKPADADHSHAQQTHAPGSNGLVSHAINPDPASLHAEGSQGSAEGEVGVNGYTIHESAPRRQPADVSTQCTAVRPSCLSRQRGHAGLSSSKQAQSVMPMR